VNVAALKNQFIGELRANKRKAGVLAVLTVVAVLLGVRLLMSGSGESPQAATAQSNTTMSDVAKALQRSHGAHRVRREREDQRQRYIENFDASITRDLFEPDTAFFPVPKDPGEAEPEPATAPEPVTPTPNPEQIRRQQIRQEARRLELQSTFVSASPTAMIDGKVLGLGDQINGFEVVKITSQSCVVKREDIEAELRLRP
jgi:hypothetical protein